MMMITYNPAFDLYHAIFRMAHIVDKLDEGESFEIERVRIWDYYLLFPDKVHTVTIRREEQDLRDYRSQFLKKLNNPYEYKGNNQKLFEWIKPVQQSALSCMVSCGMLSKELFERGRVGVADRQTLSTFLLRAGNITDRERNVLSFMSLLSRHMPLTGIYGLKARTRLMESKYDAE